MIVVVPEGIAVVVPCHRSICLAGLAELAALGLVVVGIGAVIQALELA